MAKLDKNNKINYPTPKFKKGDKVAFQNLVVEIIEDAKHFITIDNYELCPWYNVPLYNARNKTVFIYLIPETDLTKIEKEFDNDLGE